MATPINLGLNKSKPAEKAQMPEAAKTSTAFTGTPPMPAGTVVAGPILAEHLTPKEREKIAALGWTPDIPIPANMADIIRQVEAERKQEALQPVLPVNPATPPLHIPEPTPINKLPPEEQQKFRNLLTQAVAEQNARAEATRQQQETTERLSSVPGLGGAVKAAQQAEAYTAKAAEPPPAPAAVQPAQPQESATGAGAQLAFCPHCNFDLSMPDIKEPNYTDRISFLHALLGQKTWVRETKLFGGNLLVTFRTLTPKELDVAYKQAYLDRATGKAPAEADYWEALNRYRMFLQLYKLQAPRDLKGLLHELPDGLSKECNSLASTFWVQPGDEVPLEETAMPAIEQWLTANVLTTEHVFRAVHQACNQFNRTVSKLEAMADNEDFWQPTGAQS